MARGKTSGNGVGPDAKRRRLLKIGGAVGVGGAVGGTALLTALFPHPAHTQARHHHRTPVQDDTAARWLTKFVDRLAIPSTITTNQTLNGVPFFHVPLKALPEKVDPDLPPPPGILKKQNRKAHA